ncbi:MAG: recombination protein NinG [Solimonas sp.]
MRTAPLRRRSARPRCKECRGRFEPQFPSQIVCGLACSVAYARKQMARTQRSAEIAATRERRQRRAETREAKVRLRTRSDYVKRAQKAFNLFIRLRDAGKPCICCGKPLTDTALTGGGYDAGHYRSTGSAPHLRFIEDNCHAQRKVCNQHGAGRAVDYRIGLVARIGLKRVEEIEADQAPRKYTVDDLKEIEQRYRARARDLKRGNQSPAGAAGTGGGA